MRQVGDLLVWFGVILMVAAVIYIAPRLAHYYSGMELDTGHSDLALRAVTHVHPHSQARSYRIAP
jgi:hypothetical protein